MAKTKKVVLITGTSSGIGKATLDLFLQKGWRVAGTVRKINNLQKAEINDDLGYFELDLTKPQTFDKCLEKVITKFGRIDCLVNNAGFGVLGPVEGSTNEQIRQQFEVNVIGLINLTRMAIPHLRKSKSSSIINISSMAGRLTFPFYSLYASSKWAVEGFSEGLRYELRKYGVKVKLVEPGPIKTDFFSRSLVTIDTALSGKQLDHFHKIKSANQRVEQFGSDPALVAKAIYKATTDKNDRARYPAGRGVGVMLLLKRLLPTTWIENSVEMVMR
jgi:short-subunit dehydrogenase